MPGVGHATHSVIDDIKQAAKEAVDTAFRLTGSARLPTSTETAMGWKWEGQPHFHGWLRRSCCKAPDTMSHHYADCPFFNPDEVKAKARRREGEGVHEYVIATDRLPSTAVAERVLKFQVPAMVQHFLTRNDEYGEDSEFNLGLRGEYVGLSRKVQKLKRYMWAGKPVPQGAETVRTILLELAASCLMAAVMEEDERAQEDKAVG